MVDVSLGNHKPQSPQLICSFIKDSQHNVRKFKDRFAAVSKENTLLLYAFSLFSLFLFLKWSLEVSNGHMIDLQMRCKGRWVTYSSGEGAAIDAVQPIASQTLLLVKANSRDRSGHMLSASWNHLLLAGDEGHRGRPRVAILRLQLGQRGWVEQGVHLGEWHQGLRGVVGTLLGFHGHVRI